MMKFPFRDSYTALLWFRVMEMLRFLFCAQVFLVFTPPPPLLVFDLNLPCRLVAAADAFSGMVYTDLLLLLLAGRPTVSTLMAFVPIKGSTPTLQASSCALATFLYASCLPARCSHWLRTRLQVSL
jgi:hypothetical protein